MSDTKCYDTVDTSTPNYQFTANEINNSSKKNTDDMKK